MGFVSAIKVCFSKYVNFEGRATRSEYWWWALFMLFMQLLPMVLTMIDRQIIWVFLVFLVLLPLLVIGGFVGFRLLRHYGVETASSSEIRQRIALSVPLMVVVVVVVVLLAIDRSLVSLIPLGLLLPSIAVGARRLHDIGKSGWWQLLGLIPLIGWLVLIYWAAQPGQGDNAYGPASAR